MKTRRSFSHLLWVLALAITLLPLATVAQGARIRMPDFSGLAEKAKESVDISLDGDQLKSAGSFFGGGKGAPSDAEFEELVKGLQGIYVKVFEFENAGEYSMRDIDTVVRQVEREGWKKLMSVRGTGERVEMWIRDNHEDGGMFFVASEPTELVLINIVGKVNLESLRKLQGRMGVPMMPGMGAPPAPPAPPAPAAAPAPPAPAQPAR
jgi:hypothetical protein